MLVIADRNVNHVFPRALLYLRGVQSQTPSRNGMVLEIPEPVTSVYTRPLERVLFHPVRHANPFFHFFEALWILAGRRDVQFLTHFNSRMKEYSDDGNVFHGAYGYRLRHSFRIDQLEMAAEELRFDPHSRRAVLQIWDAGKDLGYGSKDIPCNDLVMLKIRNGRLIMSVHCRSNDAIWGAYGTNVVQFSFLQEYLAAGIGVEVGEYYQISDSLHVYTENDRWKDLTNTGGKIMENGVKVPRAPLLSSTCPYKEGLVEPYPLVENYDMFYRELCGVLQNVAHWCALAQVPAEAKGVFREFSNSFFHDVVLPIAGSWISHKQKDYASARVRLEDCCALDWKLAMQEWLDRTYRDGA